MFGYVRPVKEALTEEQFLDFRAVYCGLCRMIGRRYGVCVSGILNYDFTFLSLLLDCGQTHQTDQLRCLPHPIEKRSARLPSQGLETAADISVLLTWYKLADGAADERGMKSLAALAAGKALNGARRRAESYLPEYAARVRKDLRELSVLEKAGESSLDRMADIFARLLSDIPEGDSPRARILSEILYHTGRWIYILDALDDFEEDVRAGAYNPIAARFGCEKSGLDEEIRKTVAFTLENSLAAAARAFELLDPKSDEAILRNIIYLGMPRMMEQVLCGGKGQKEKRNDRSV